MVEAIRQSGLGREGRVLDVAGCRREGMLELEVIIVHGGQR